VSSAWSQWHGVRRQRAQLLERWGGSPAELPRLPLDDPAALFEQARARAQREAGIVQQPAQLVPAPRSLVTGEAVAVDGMRRVTAADVARRAAEAA
jgi:hypothetical protein